LPYIRTILADRIKKEMVWFLIGSLLLSAVTLLLFFRSFSATLMSLSVVIMGVIWSFGTMVLMGQKITLLTHFQVREDAQQLFGFATETEREAFRALIKISGVGSRTALAVLSGMSVNELAQAIALQEAGRLTQVPGIGKKTAERLCLELKGKLAPDLGISSGKPQVIEASSEVLQALLALGYSEKEALLALKQIPPDSTVSDGIRMGLKYLSKA
jgi:Holliday junction DNA helicase RuvA